MLPSSSSPGALTRIEDKLDRIEQQLARFDVLIEQAPNLLAIVGDTFDEVAGELDLDARLRGALRLLERLSRPETLAQIERLLDVAERLPDATGSARLGLFGLLRQFRDPDVQRALGFTVDLARRLGHEMAHPHALTAGNGGQEPRS